MKVPAALLAALLLTASLHAAQPTQGAISSDGRLRAWIKPVSGEPGASGEHASALWITDRRTGRDRQLFRGAAAVDPRRNLTSLADPHFSLDGGFIYVEADAYATSPAIHQVSVATGRTRYITDGGLIGILRNGPWRGYLIVQQHRYRPEGGSVDPIAIIKPNGVTIADVPGTARGDGRKALGHWLNSKGWTAT